MIKRIGLLLTLVAMLAFSAIPAGAVAYVSPSGQATGPTNHMATNFGMVSNGGVAVVGSMSSLPIGTPSVPTMTTNGAAGSTSLVYACTAFDINGNQTIPSATATIATANATLSATNSVNVTCPGKTGAMGFLVHKADTSHVIGYCYANSGVGCTFVDTGSYTNGNGGTAQASSFTYTPNTVDQTGGFTTHILSEQGVTALPTVGTGTVAAGGTDNAMEVSGGTSPVTVTFATAFVSKPVCACGDISSATGVCKVVPNANGATAVVTTAGTDTFDMICIGK